MQYLFKNNILIRNGSYTYNTVVEFLKYFNLLFYKQYIQFKILVDRIYINFKGLTLFKTAFVRQTFYR